MHQTIPSQAVTTAAPVELDATAKPDSSVSITIAKLSTVTATAAGPGEVAGPAVSATVRITNESGASLPLDAVSVTMADSHGNPAPLLVGTGSEPFAGTLGKGASATGVYVFTIAPDVRNPVTVAVSYAPGHTTVQFTGAPPS